MHFDDLADRALRGESLTDAQALRVLASSDDELLSLLAAAFRVRRAHFGRRVRIQILKSAKSGLCGEDCAYCSQSSVSRAEIRRHDLLPAGEIVEGAREAKRWGAHRYCIVTSGAGPRRDEVDSLVAAIERIRREVGIRVCCSLGALGEDELIRLREAGVDRINHNLNTSVRFHPLIATTHRYEDRVAMLARVRKAGLSICCGAIFGMGEGPEDVVAVGRALREIRADSIPVNFLIAIPGTPLAGAKPLSPRECLRILSLLRFLNPDREIRIAAGREVHLRSLGPLALYPANSLFAGGYLTAPGDDVETVRRMIEDLGFEIEG